MARRRAFIQAVIGGVAALALAFGGATSAMAADSGDSVSEAVTWSAEGTGAVDISVAEASEPEASDPVAPEETEPAAPEETEPAATGETAPAVPAVSAPAVPAVSAPTVSAPAAPAGVSTGSISGVVTQEDDGTPLAGVLVSTGGEGTPWVEDYTDESGAYSLTGLAPGSYLVSFFPVGTDLQREYWKDTAIWSDGTLVVIGEGTAVTGIDASLKRGATISGVVTTARDGSALAGVTVNALDQHEIVGAAQTGADGSYRIEGLSEGEYVVQFLSPDGEQLATEYWQNVYGYDAATAVSVTGTETAAGIDAALDAVGHIEGTVTQEGREVPMATVWIRSTNGDGYISGHSVEGDGTYSAALPPGTYVVEFRSFSDEHADEYWENARTIEEATPVVVGSSQRVTGIDAVMDRAGLISGGVSIDSDDVRGILVEAWQGDRLVGSAQADYLTGEYTLRLLPGTYILKASAEFLDGSTLTAKPQYFDGVTTAAQATPVPAVVGTPVNGVDFTLVPVEVQPQPMPTLELSVGSIQAGKDITVSGTGFAPGATIAFELRSDPIALGTLTADADGVLRGSLRIPASAPAGTHSLVALSGGAVIASATLVVTAAAEAGGGAAVTPGTRLAATGAETPTAIIALGVMLAVLGGLLVRRRRVES